MGLTISNLLYLSVWILTLFLFLLQSSSFKILFYRSISFTFVILLFELLFSSGEGGWEVKAKTKLLQHLMEAIYYSLILISKGWKLE